MYVGIRSTSLSLRPTSRCSCVCGAPLRVAVVPFNPALFAVRVVYPEDFRVRGRDGQDAYLVACRGLSLTYPGSPRTYICACVLVWMHPLKLCRSDQRNHLRGRETDAGCHERRNLPHLFSEPAPNPPLWVLSAECSMRICIRSYAHVLFNSQESRGLLSLTPPA